MNELERNPEAAYAEARRTRYRSHFSIADLKLNYTAIGSVLVAICLTAYVCSFASPAEEQPPPLEAVKSATAAPIPVIPTPTALISLLKPTPEGSPTPPLAALQRPTYEAKSATATAIASKNLKPIFDPKPRTTGAQP